MAFTSWSPSPEIDLLSTSEPASPITLPPSANPFPSDDSLSSSSSSSSTEFLDNFLDGTRIAIQRVLSVIVVAFGTFGNLMSIAVLTRRSMKSSTNRYLTALAVYDTLYLVFALTMTLSHYDAVRQRWWYGQYRMPFGRPLTDICSNTGIWLTLTFTVERYIGVCYPMKGKVMCTPRRAQYVILFVCVAAFLVTSPEFFEIQMVEDVDASNRTLLRPRMTQFARLASYQFGYLYANQILFTFLPLLLLLAFNSLLIRAVMYATKNRRRMTLGDLQVLTPSNHRSSDPQERHQRDQQRITVMLIVVVIVFLICQLPQAVHKVCHVYMDWLDAVGPREEVILRIAGNYFNLLVMINSSVNFVLYSSFSTKFRTTFFRIFCVRIRPRGRASLDSFRLGIQGTYFAQTECTNALTDLRRRTAFRMSVGEISLEGYDAQRRRSRSASVATADRILRNAAIR